jgi:3-methyladenine DNA glycosylase Tag
MKTEVAKGNGYSEQANDSQKYHLHWGTQNYFMLIRLCCPKLQVFGVWTKILKKNKKFAPAFLQFGCKAVRKMDDFFPENGPDDGQAPLGYP